MTQINYIFNHNFSTRAVHTYLSHLRLEKQILCMFIRAITM